MTPAAPPKWILKLLPRELREEYGRDIQDLFAARLQDELAQHGTHAAVRFWCRGVVDLLATAWRARVRQLRGHPSIRRGERAGLLESIRQDLWHSLRSLRHHPRFAALVVLTLGLGIGATTTIFSVMDAVLLRPLPFPNPDRLVRIGVRTERQPAAAAPHGDIVAAWKRHSRQFDGLDWTGTSISTYTMTGAGDTTLVRRQFIGPTLFQVLGVPPRIGRTIEPDDIGSGANQRGVGRTVVLSHEFWQRQFNGEASVLGSAPVILGLPRLVVGVMPAGFRVSPTAADVDVWMGNDYTGTDQRWMATGRLKPEASTESAAAELQSILDGVKLTPPPKERWLVSVSPLGLDGRDNYRANLYVIAGAVGLVLLICCVNVMGLMLVRAAARAREIATRLALGADRPRIVRQLLVESVLLATAGGAAGIFIAVFGLRLFVLIASDWYPATEAFTLNLRVLGFALAVSLVAGVATGLVPALKAPRTNVMRLVREGDVAPVRRGRRRFGSLLVIVEVALALILVIGVGLMFHSLARILAVDLGFESRGLLTAQIRTQGDRYQISDAFVHNTPPAVEEFYTRLVAELERRPGVESVGLISTLPTTIQVARVRLRVPGRADAAPDRPAYVQYQEINDGLFRTMRAPLLQGRAFSGGDTVGSPWVAIVNEALVRQFFPGENPIGRVIHADVTNGVKRPGLVGDRPREIVGVVGDLRLYLRRPAMPAMYVPLTQHLAVYPLLGSWQFPGPWAVHLQKDIVIRGSSNPEQLVGALRESVAAVDPTQLAHSIRTMEDSVSLTAGAEWRWMRLLGLCAGIALFLAALGIYGVVSQGVARRTKEIGIRLALGADRRHVLRMVVKEGMTPVLIGVVLGVGVAVGLTQLIASMLFEVTPTDMQTYAAACVVLGVVAALACYIPARRTTRVGPIVALRHD